MKKFRVTVNGNSYEVEVEELVGEEIVASKSQIGEVKNKIETPRVSTHQVQGVAESKKIISPMPGKIVDLKVKIGEEIKEGALVAILEAMKMENEIFATESGKVASINASVGMMVESQDIIMTLS